MSWILAAMLFLAPARDHSRLAGAINRVVASESPLFRDDADKRRTTAYLVAIAFRESSLKPDAVGDHGLSFCAFQIHRTNGGSKALTEDVDACVSKAFAMLRESARICPAHPLAWYAEGGVHACSSARAQRISRDRLALAARLLREVNP